MGVMSAIDREIVISRVFDAPRDLVFKAWTQPDLMMRWLCPKDFTVLFAEVDLRVGGKWRSGMKSPDGNEYFMHGAYRVIVEPEMLVFTHAWEDGSGRLGPQTIVTVAFEEEASGQTRMHVHQAIFESRASRDGHQGGWNESFDRLEAWLEEAQS